MNKVLSISALLWFAVSALQAQLLPEAASAFPAKTFALEYDALAKLRLLPAYASLRKQYSGEALQRAQKDLSSMGISEGQLTEVVTASGPNGFFGMLSGNFHAPAVTKEAARHGIPQTALEDGPLFCVNEGTCFLLISKEDGRGFFGTKAQMQAISEVRQGRAPSLETNPVFVDLNSRMDQQAPVLGFAPGAEISQWIGSGIPQSIAARLDLSSLFSNIQIFGYAVKLDSKAHVGLNLICSSDEAGTLLKNALSAASGLERAAAMATGSSALPFDNMAVQSSGRLVAVNLDAPIQ